MKHACWSVFALAFFAAPALADDVTKEDVVKLAKAGISDEIIIKFLTSKGAKLDLSASEVVELKTAGVSDTVIAHLLKTADHPESHGTAKKAAPKPVSPPPALRSNRLRTTTIPYNTSRSVRTYAIPNYYSSPRTYYFPLPYTYSHHSYGHHSYGHHSYGHHSSNHHGGHRTGHH